MRKKEGGTYCISLGQPQAVFSQLHPSLTPFTPLLLPFDISSGSGRSWRNSLEVKESGVSTLPCCLFKRCSYLAMQDGSQRCFLNDKDIDHLVFVPRGFHIGQQLVLANRSLCIGRLIMAQVKYAGEVYSPMPKSCATSQSIQPPTPAPNLFSEA